MFWGWGREDDELYLRMKEAGMKVWVCVCLCVCHHTHLLDMEGRKEGSPVFNITTVVWNPCGCPLMKERLYNAVVYIVLAA